MRLTLEQLQKIVQKTMDDEKSSMDLRREIAKALGPVVIIEGKIEDVVAAANDRLDVLERTGRIDCIDFAGDVAVSYLKHPNTEIRKFAARVVPSKHLAALVNEMSSVVRSAAVTRMPLKEAKQMMKRFSSDDQLRTAYNRRIAESGVATPEQGEHLNIHADDRLGDVGKQQPGPELSDQWYKDKAHKLYQDYGGNIENSWEELAVRRYCSSTKATSGVDIDASKLLKAVKDVIEAREDMALERDALKETLDWLDSLSSRETLNESADIHMFDESVDPVQELLQRNLTSEEFVTESIKLFNIKHATLPKGIRKHCLGEGNSSLTNVPVIATLPHDGGFRAIDERALDKFCEAWNTRQAFAGEPLKVSWDTHQVDANKAGFSITLK